MRVRAVVAASLLALLSWHLSPATALTPPRPQASYSAPVASSGPTAESGRAALVAAIRAAQAQQEANVAAWVANVPKPARAPTVRDAAPSPAVYGHGACGGDLPPCSVMMCESGGSLTAQNPRSTASGKWQILDSTWAGYGGYSRAMYAPEDVQDARAREIYAGGAGRRAWVC